LACSPAGTLPSGSDIVLEVMPVAGHPLEPSLSSKGFQFDSVALERYLAAHIEGLRGPLLGELAVKNPDKAIARGMAVR
jgi:hypothetical protein